MFVTHAWKFAWRKKKVFRLLRSAVLPPGVSITPLKGSGLCRGTFETEYKDVYFSRTSEMRRVKQNLHTFNTHSHNIPTRTNGQDSASLDQCHSSNWSTTQWVKLLSFYFVSSLLSTLPPFPHASILTILPVLRSLVSKKERWTAESGSAALRR